MAALPALEMSGFARHQGLINIQVQGIIVDVLTLRPLSGAHVWLEPFGQRSFTNHRGHFRLPTPPGLYTLYAEAEGYVGLRLVNLELAAERSNLGTIEMVPLNIPVEQELRLYNKVVLQPQSQLPPPEVLAPRKIVSPTPVSDQQLPLVTVEQPEDASISETLPTYIDVRWPDGRTESIALEEYLKGVVASEVPANWPVEALKAQAVTARTYTLAYVRSIGPICTTTSCQVYNPNVRHATTDAAVDATAGVVATYGGSAIWAFYFSRCNSFNTVDSERAINWRTCHETPWSHVPYCRSRPCGGHERYDSTCGYFGHGVGMCQWGAWARAKEGLVYGQIIDRYYTGVQLQVPGGPPSAPQAISQRPHLIGPPITIGWSGTADQFNVELWNHSGTFLTNSGWIAANQWIVSGLPSAKYYWRVRGRNAAGEGQVSSIQTLEVQPIAAQLHFPAVRSYDRQSGW